MTKKQLKEKNKQNRVLVPFNTGTRTIKTEKDYDRKKVVMDLRKAMEEEGY